MLYVWKHLVFALKKHRVCNIITDVYENVQSYASTAVCSHCVIRVLRYEKSGTVTRGIEGLVCGDEIFDEPDNTRYAYTVYCPCPVSRAPAIQFKSTQLKKQDDVPRQLFCVVHVGVSQGLCNALKTRANAIHMMMMLCCIRNRTYSGQRRTGGGCWWASVILNISG